MIAHRPVAFCTYWTKVINVERTTLTFRQIMTYFKHKGCHDIFTPCHETFMFEIFFTTIKNPYLFA